MEAVPLSLDQRHKFKTVKYNEVTEKLKYDLLIPGFNMQSQKTYLNKV